MKFNLKMMLTSWMLLLLTTILNGYNIAPKNYSGSIKILKQQKLDYYFKSAKFAELSDLAYDSSTSTLYMVSDKGSFFTFRATFSDNNYKLNQIAGYKLRSKKGKRLKRWKRDSEGLALDSHKNLYISFEGKPKISLFTKKGQRVKNIKLPRILKRVRLRSKNKSLEALAWHPKYGLITALEYSKVGDKKQDQTIYSTSGKIWRIKLEDIPNNAITALEVMDDGNLLILERAYNGIFGKFEVNLVKLYINSCQERTFCKKKLLLSIDNAKGWEVNNFEGLTKVGKNRYLMISDDNDSLFASTILIYFKVIE